MIAWLLDTLLWTGALIALVLLVRRPVARLFGAQVAYALWLLPFARLVLPPVELPANWAPQSAPLPVAATAVPLSDAVILSAAAPVPAAPSLPFGLLEIAVALWLTGAVAFFALRLLRYRRVRDAILAQARPVGEVDDIRLVESAAVDAPIAFGIRDKVVALPPAFIASENIAARDLAIAHELAHHRGRDLLINLAVQPLFALHWFNPLGWLGWQALRRDQEAACDARVVAGAGQECRALYAATIAGFAAGPRMALAAPMACPVLGEKSIIQRLRSLSMPDIPVRRRLLGRVLVAGGALALPLTASVSYAAAEAPDMPAPPVPPAAPQPLEAVPLPPSAPPAPQASALAPEPPLPPVAPRPVDAEIVTAGAFQDAVVIRNGNRVSGAERAAALAQVEAAKAQLDARGIEREARLTVLRSLDCDRSAVDGSEDAFERAVEACAFRFERQALSLARDSIELARVQIDTDRTLSAAQRREALAGLDEALAELDAED